MRSEITMLRQYGPNVPEETLSRLVKAFSELRTMADEGHIQVNIFYNKKLGGFLNTIFSPSDNLEIKINFVFCFSIHTRPEKL